MCSRGTSVTYEVDAGIAASALHAAARTRNEKCIDVLLTDPGLIEEVDQRLPEACAAPTERTQFHVTDNGTGEQPIREKSPCELQSQHEPSCLAAHTPAHSVSSYSGFVCGLIPEAMISENSGLDGGVISDGNCTGQPGERSRSRVAAHTATHNLFSYPDMLCSLEEETEIDDPESDEECFSDGNCTNHPVEIESQLSKPGEPYSPKPICTRFFCCIGFRSCK